MTLRKGILIAVAVAVTIVVLTLVLWHSKPLRWFLMGTTMDMDNIRFYGRVIDQHGQAVVGAVVPFEIGGSALGGYRGASKRITDANGEFSIEVEGSGLSLLKITHPDIEFGYPIPEETKTTWNYSYKDTMDVYGFQPQRGANEVLWSDTSPENPYIFKAWRIAGEPEQIAKNLKLGTYKYIYSYDNVYTLDLLKPIMEAPKEGEREGQLRVIFHREVDADNVTQRWEARLIPVDGGIQVTKDPYMNIAPETGYEPEIHIVREKTGYDSIDNLSNQQYYFKANNGKTYGSLFVSFNANVYKQLKMNITYKLNPDGERILVKAPSPN